MTRKLKGSICVLASISHKNVLLSICVIWFTVTEETELYASIFYKYISISIREWIKISEFYSPLSVCQMMRFCWVRMVVECTEEQSFFLKSQMRMGNSKSRHRVSTLYSLYLPEQLTFSSSVMKLSEWNEVGVFELAGGQWFLPVGGSLYLLS